MWVNIFPTCTWETHTHIHTHISCGCAISLMHHSVNSAIGQWEIWCHLRNVKFCGSQKKCELLYNVRQVAPSYTWYVVSFLSLFTCFVLFFLLHKQQIQHSVRWARTNLKLARVLHATDIFSIIFHISLLAFTFFFCGIDKTAAAAAVAENK